MSWRLSSQVLELVLIALLAFMLPVGVIGDGSAPLVGDTAGWVLAGLALLALAVTLVIRRGSLGEGLLAGAAGILLGLILLLRLRGGLGFTPDLPWMWVLAALIVILLWRAMSRLAGRSGRLTAVLVPLLFGAALVYFWEVLTVGFGVRRIILPPPSAIATAFGNNLDTLWVDLFQTFLRAAVPGWIIGCLAGFLTAVAIDRSPFLQRGLMPIGTMLSAMPIVGIAPIMVMWFGFNWQSKAAVVVVMTFFPMLVNTLAGLQASSAMERDLMRSYAAGYGQTLAKLRLPAALPFIFTALKLNATLALIGAIVAEFFGTPTYGMGFRISTLVARLQIDTVWATIAVAALAGTASYAALALLERALTFWHPSQRG